MKTLNDENVLKVYSLSPFQIIAGNISLELLSNCITCPLLWDNSAYVLQEAMENSSFLLF